MTETEKNAVATEVKDVVSVVRNRRTDAMFVCAYVAVGALVYAVLFVKGISEYAQGVITLVLGNFIGYLTAMYNFETGTTRGAQAKDATIKTMAENTIPVPAPTNGTVTTTVVTTDKPPEKPA